MVACYTNVINTITMHNGNYSMDIMTFLTLVIKSYADNFCVIILIEGGNG